MSQEVVENSSGYKQNSKIGSYQWKTLWASTVGYAMDGLDMMILSFTMPLIMAYFSINPAEAGSISTITLLGAVIGGIVFGILADKYGRVRVFTWTILIFSVFTGLCALSPNMETLMVFRFLAGLGLGGEFGIGMTLVSEAWPKKYRSRATSIVAVGFQLGIVLATLSVLFISPAFGWQGVFVAGIVPALLAFWSRKNLEEPEQWLQLKHDKKNKIAIGHLFSSLRTTATTIGLIIATSVQNFGFYGIMTWMPTMLANELGYTFNKTTVWTVVTIVGMIIGIIVFGILADKIGRKPSYLIFLLSAAVIIWIYFQQSTPIVLLVLGGVLGFFVNGMMGGYGALLAEHYSTGARSTAENVIFNVGRAVAGFAPLIIGYISLNHSLSYALSLLSGIYVLSALSFIFLIPETKGKELD
ncbi:MFS transporter [Bacillus capparidis]|uniref:Benzoate transport n=1 Tax=Bacillus capparidis TaxID=1840411 RepID=A0ABS4D2E9_9BACI|nr:MFS transporter [Bacillus capparidis]MBP1083782.1 benzoate transport [Bacillus capparidis]MED1098267.1 MFS transporter [Bacillus capparidis]